MSRPSTSGQRFRNALAQRVASSDSIARAMHGVAFYVSEGGFGRVVGMTLGKSSEGLGVGCSVTVMMESPVGANIVSVTAGSGLGGGVVVVAAGWT